MRGVHVLLFDILSYNTVPKGTLLTQVMLAISGF